MYGAETSSLSSTIAKCCEASIGLPPKRVVGAALGDLARRVAWNALRPLSVKSKVTIGCVAAGAVSKFCSGFLMSVPVSAGLVLDDPPAVGLGCALGGAPRRAGRAMPCGTSTTSAFGPSVSSSVERSQRLQVLASRTAGRWSNGFFGLVVDEVVARRSCVSLAGRSSAGTWRRSHGVVLRCACRVPLPAAGPPVTAVRRVGLAVLVEDVRSPSRRRTTGRSSRPARRRARRSSTPGRLTSIWSLPERWISGSETPNASTRSRMMSIERWSASA